MAKIAEQAARDAGMDVVDTGEYYEKYSGRRMGVSQWEGHPSEEAHGIFAGMLYARIEHHPALSRYQNTRK